MASDPAIAAIGAVPLLSIQDMDPLDAIAASTDWALRPQARIVMLLTHPAFRQPRHSGCGYDQSRGLIYRRVDAYLREMAVPMTAPGRRTLSFHRPISAYVNAFAEFGFALDVMLELPDLPAPERPSSVSRRYDDACEFPLFLALRFRTALAHYALMCSRSRSTGGHGCISTPVGVAGCSS